MEFEPKKEQKKENTSLLLDQRGEQTVHEILDKKMTDNDFFLSQDETDSK